MVLLFWAQEVLAGGRGVVVFGLVAVITVAVVLTRGIDDDATFSKDTRSSTEIRDFVDEVSRDCWHDEVGVDDSDLATATMVAVAVAATATIAINMENRWGSA